MNRNGIDINALGIFRAVAELGSVSAAAEKLCYVQSNITSRIQRLEQALDTVLFLRQKRGMVLTHAGENLLWYADRILRLVDEACAVVTEIDNEGGILRIGAHESIAAARLPTILSELHRRHSNIQIEVSTGSTDPLVRDVLGFRLDGAFVGGKVNHPEIICKRAFTEDLVLIESRNHKESTNQKRTVLLAFRRGCPFRIKAETLFREKGWAPMRIMELGTLDGILGCAAAGIGVAILPRSAVDQSRYSDALKFTHISQSIGRIQTMFIYRRDTVAISGLKYLLEVLEPKVGLVRPGVSRTSDCC